MRNNRKVCDLMNEPKISIIIPVYNGERFIGTCVENILAQNYDNVEICFVIDHKTTDGTFDRVKEQMELHSNINYITQNDNGRLGFARNIGIENTTGKYIWFLDVDDRPFPTYIQDLVRIMEDTSSDMTFCNFYSSTTYEFPELKGEYTVITMDRLDALKYRASGKLPVTSWSMIYRRDLLIDNDLRFKSGLAEDLDFTYRALDASKTVSYYNKPLYLYYQNPTSICNAGNENKRASEELDVYKKLFEYFEKNDPEFYPYFKDKAILSSMRCMGHFDKKEFMNFYRNGWVRKMFIEMKKNRPFAETFIFRHMPRLYHYVVSRGLKKIYQNSMFDNNVSTSSSKRWFNKHFKNI